MIVDFIIIVALIILLLITIVNSVTISELEAGLRELQEDVYDLDEE